MMHESESPPGDARVQPAARLWTFGHGDVDKGQRPLQSLAKTRHAATHLVIVRGALACGRLNDLVAVRALQKDDSRWSATAVVLEVEEQVLEEDEPSQLPLAVLGSALEQISARPVVVERLLRQGQQLQLVHPQTPLHFSSLVFRGTQSVTCRVVSYELGTDFTAFLTSLVRMRVSAINVFD